MVKAFSFERCQSSSAQVDVKKLSWMNYEYILTLSEDQFRQATEKALNQEKISAEKEQIDQLIPLIRERVKTLSDIGPLSRFLFADDYVYNEKAVSKKLVKEGVSETLIELRELLAVVEPFDAASLEDLLHTYVERSGKGFGVVMPPLRIAVSGEQGGPDLCPVLAMLGREEVLRRIDRTRARFLD
jgi:glutamyl-tRNA synthetase